MGKLISLNAVIVIAAVLYWYGALAVYERNLFLQTANLTSATASYPDILFQGFESVLLFMVALPIIYMSISCLIPLVLNYDVLRDRFSRSTDVNRKRWILFVCEIVLFFVTALGPVISTGALSKGEQGLLLLRPDAKASGAFSLNFGPFSFNFLVLWAVLLLATFGDFVWRYLKEATVNGKRTALVLGVLWFVFQMDFFARACGVFPLQEFGVPEIRIQERTQASLDGARVFLLGQTADRYVLLTIKEPGAQRAIVMVRNDQLPMFNIVGRADVFHNPVRSKP